jgi:hypothetical protein
VQNNTNKNAKMRIKTIPFKAVFNRVYPKPVLVSKPIKRSKARLWSGAFSLGKISRFRYGLEKFKP